VETPERTEWAGLRGLERARTGSLPGRGRVERPADGERHGTNALHKPAEVLRREPLDHGILAEVPDLKFYDPDEWEE